MSSITANDQGPGRLKPSASHLFVNGLKIVVFGLKKKWSRIRQTGCTPSSEIFYFEKDGH